MWIYIARESSEFDTGSIIVKIDQLESDSYFRGCGLINGKLEIRNQICFSEIDFINIDL